MIKTFSRFLNTYKLHPVELNNRDSYELLFKTGVESINVTHNTVLIGLDKPTLAVKPGIRINMEDDCSLDILKNNIFKANLKLKIVKLDAFKSDTSVCFFEVTKAAMDKRKLKKYFDILFLILKNLTDKKSKNFKVSAPSLVSLFAYYIMPLPVYALCIGNITEVDIFPDDILGSIHGGYYFFSVRTTNPSVKKIISQKNVALCLVPFNKKSEMYSLGKHHKKGVIDIHNLDFKLMLSHAFKIPVPGFAINAIELNVLENFEYGGYTVFYAQTVNLTNYSNEFPLAHTPWYNI